MESERKWAFVKMVIFLICSINLLISIVLTIITEPGYIPEDNEWDMPAGSEGSSGSLNVSK